MRGKQKTIYFESDSWILIPTIENLKSKMGKGCGLREERQGQSDFRFLIWDFRLGTVRQIDFRLRIFDFGLI